MPTQPPDVQPTDGSSSDPRDDQLPAEPTHANPIARIQNLTSRSIAKHPTLLRVLEWLSWNNPGASMNP